MRDERDLHRRQSSFRLSPRTSRRLAMAALSLVFAFVLFQRPDAAVQRSNTTNRSQLSAAALEALPLDDHERGLVKAMADAIVRNGVVSQKDAEQLAEDSIRRMRVVELRGRLAGGVAAGDSVRSETVPPPAKLELDPLSAEVLTLDRQFQQARVNNDVATVDRIVSDGYTGTDKFGDRWSKRELLELWAWALMESIETTTATVRFCGDDAIVEGREIQTMPHRTDHLLFTRVYRRGGTARWQLVANTQVSDSRGQ